MDDENRILTLEEFKEMERKYEEPVTVNYHLKQSQALDVAMAALKDIAAKNWYNDVPASALIPSAVCVKSMSVSANEALKDISEILE